MSKPSSGHYSGTHGTRAIRANSAPNPQRAPVERITAGDIRFSQVSVNGSQDIADSMKKNGWVGDPIDVVVMRDGAKTTLDNTRVVAAREAGIEVRAVVHAFDDPLPNRQTIERFTTDKGTPYTWGRAVELRIRKQRAAFRNKYPNGSYNMGRIN